MRNHLGFLIGVLVGGVLTAGAVLAVVLVLGVDVGDSDPAPVVATSVEVPAAAEPAPVPDSCPDLPTGEPPWQPDPAAEQKELELPKPSARLERRIKLWEDMWGKHAGRVYVFLDSRRPSYIHDIVDCRDLFRKYSDENVADKACDRRLIAKKRSLKKKLYKLRRRPPRRMLQAYDSDRRRAKQLVGSAHRNIKLVQGKATKLEEAIQRAAPYLDTLKSIFKTVGVPPELTRLAFVESLFQPEIVSKAGAVGAYQFMTPTGRQWLMINDGVDERLDPLRAGWAAANYLQQMNRRFDSWPLALTGYNTGPTRVKRMVKRHRTRDIGKLADIKTEKNFGFDGQNYYASLAAVVRVTEALAPVPVEETLVHAQLPEPMALRLVAACVRSTPEALISLNPALSEGVKSGAQAVPKGYWMRLPSADKPAVSADESAKKGEQPS
jgi:hypothetical protein